MILKGKINEKFQNEEKVKKSQEREREWEEKERERKHGLEKQKIEFEKERIQAEKRNGRKINIGKTYHGKNESWNGRKNCHHEWDW